MRRPSSSGRILAGDIGGTKTILAVYEDASPPLRPLAEATLLSREHATFDEVLRAFAPAWERPVRAACFGVAGPVIGGVSRTTNLPWVLEEERIARFLDARRVRLLNDLEAAAYGMLHLGADELEVLNEGLEQDRPGNAAVIAAGTGLGEATLFWDGTRHHAVASEGGHGDFAPRTDQEIELFRYLRHRFGGHVSYERILSGPGLGNVYEFLRDSGVALEPDWLREELKSGDKAATISRAGLEKGEPLCLVTLELFASIYGAEAGNLALRSVAVGGLFVGGGIAPKLLTVLRGGGFLKAFTDKGRFAEMLRNTRVSVGLNPRAPLIGAAHTALALR